MSVVLNEIQKEALETVSGYRPLMEWVGKTLWQHPEVGPNEYRSAAFLTGLLEEQGFTLRRGVCGFPTGFIAEYAQKNAGGEKPPVICILCEFDALPGMSSVRVGDPGHGCGHNLFAASAVTAACALKDTAARHNVPCTLRVYGTPSEENYSSKAYYIKNGLFDDVDLSVAFHATDHTEVSYRTSSGTNYKRYTFHGKPAHAADFPWLGLSALDAVELMNVAVNYLREHVRPDVRMHYIITKGGDAPNIVPELAQSDYYLRAADMPYLEEVTRRVDTIAEAAAMASGCTVDIQLRDQLYNLVLVREYCEIAQQYLEAVGPPPFSREELERAKAYGDGSGLQTDCTPLPASEGYMGGSTDEGDVSWVVPHVSIYMANIAGGTIGHTLDFTRQMDSSWAYTAAQQQVKATVAMLLDLMGRPEEIARLKEAHTKKLEGNTYPRNGKMPPLFIFADTPGVSFVENCKLDIKPEELALLRKNGAWELAVEDEQGESLAFSSAEEIVSLNRDVAPGETVKLFARYPGGKKELIGYCHCPQH